MARGRGFFWKRCWLGTTDAVRVSWVLVTVTAVYQRPGEAFRNGCARRIKPGSRLRGLDPEGVAEVVQMLL